MRQLAALPGWSAAVWAAVSVQRIGADRARHASHHCACIRQGAPHRITGRGALAADIMVQPDAHANSHGRGCWRRLINPNGVRMLSAIARYPNTATSGRNRPTMISAT
jgi:hypothetical protein